MNKKYFVPVLVCAAAFLAGFAMWPSARNGFVWDDSTYVVGNSLTRDLSARGIGRIFSSVHYGLYKPVTMLSFAVNYKFSGLEPRPYHVTNIALHTVNTALVFALVFMLAQSVWAAFLCAVLFGVHPMHVESVAWVSERKDMLYALFFLMASILYVKFAQTRNRAAMAGSVLCFILSLCAKPMGITLPAVVFVYDYLLGRVFDRRLVFEKLPYFLVALGFGTATYLFLESADQIQDRFAFGDRVLFIFYGLEFYIGKLLLPLNLSALYSLPIKNGAHLPLEYLLSPVVVLGCILLLVKYFRHHRIIMAGMAFYIITVSPVLQFLGVGPVITADRYSYIPSLGLFMPLAYYSALGLKKLFSVNRLAFWTGAVCAAGLIVVLAWTSRARCEVWHDNYVLFSDAAIKYPDIYSMSLYAEALRLYGNPAAAEQVLKAAVKMSMPLRGDASNIKNVVLTVVLLAEVLYEQGKDDEAERHLASLKQLTSNCAPMLLLSAELEAKKGNKTAALGLLEQASRTMFSAKEYSRAGDICVKLGAFPLASKYYDRAHELDSFCPPGAEKLRKAL